MDNRLILDKHLVSKKLERIAFEIYEDHMREEEVIVAGVADGGYRLAELLKSEIEKISSLKVELLKITLNKKSTVLPEVALSPQLAENEKRSVIITDDVLNTGRTLSYCVQAFLRFPLRKLRTAVLVNRDHRLFPVSPDYVGYALSTTVKEHVEVTTGKETEVYLY